MPPKILHVLHVEDDLVEVDLFQRALRKSNITIDHQVVDNGEDALFYLSKQGQYANAKRPDLILLDLNLPKIDGREVLLEIKRKPPINLIPVVVLTTSRSDLDTTYCYGHGAACYVVKAADHAVFTAQIKKLFDFWQDVEMAPAEK